MTYDIKISGGTILDGTGSPGYVGDVGISDELPGALLRNGVGRVWAKAV